MLRVTLKFTILYPRFAIDRVSKRSQKELRMFENARSQIEPRGTATWIQGNMITTWPMFVALECMRLFSSIDYAVTRQSISCLAQLRCSLLFGV